MRKDELKKFKDHLNRYCSQLTPRILAVLNQKIDTIHNADQEIAKATLVQSSSDRTSTDDTQSSSPTLTAIGAEKKLGDEFN